MHPSALAALEKLAQHNPELANKIMDATTHAISKETSARNIAVISTSAVLAVTIGVTALIIIFNGLASGIVFFLCLVAIAAICGAIFAKKAVDLSWTASILGGSAKPDTPERE
ncbi:hypothetical protein MPC1_4880003 [Methylocella tundrae]|nr:hypothetical protein MPC1_4880003 [Methylocella tundrae]